MRYEIFGYFFGSKEKQEFRIFAIYTLMPFFDWDPRLS